MDQPWQDLAHSIRAALYLTLGAEKMLSLHVIASSQQFDPNDLISVEGEIPDELKIERVDLNRLSLDWHEPRETSVRELGDDWIHAAKTVALLVP